MSICAKCLAFMRTLETGDLFTPCSGECSDAIKAAGGAENERYRSEGGYGNWQIVDRETHEVVAYHRPTGSYASPTMKLIHKGVVPNG